jgi:hypothetical protein
MGVPELLSRGQQLLARRQGAAAAEVFAQAYALAVAGDEPVPAAHALLGQARAEFAVHRLEAAARHAGTARDLLSALGLPEARHAADLLAQIDHHRYLR